MKYTFVEKPNLDRAKDENITTTHDTEDVEGLAGEMTYEMSSLTDDELDKLAIEDPFNEDIPKDFVKNKTVKNLDLKKAKYDDIPVGVRDQEGVPLVGNAESINSDYLVEEGGVFYKETDGKNPPVEAKLNYTAEKERGQAVQKENGSWSTGSHKFKDVGVEGSGKNKKQENSSQTQSKKQNETQTEVGVEPKPTSDQTPNKKTTPNILSSTSGQQVSGGVYRPIKRNRVGISESEEDDLATLKSLKRESKEKPNHYYDEIPPDVVSSPGTPPPLPPLRPGAGTPPPLPSSRPEAVPPPLPKRSRGELLDSIDKENELTRMINSNEFGPAKGFVSTHFEKLKSKFGWVKDGLVSFFALGTKEIKLDATLGWNGFLLNKKLKELDMAKKKAQKAESSSEQDRLDRENRLEKINESLEQARRDGDNDMIDSLTRAKEVLEKQNSRELAGEAVQNIQEQMLFYRKRKERILEDFIGDIDTYTEDIRGETEYYKNLERRGLLDDGIGRLQKVITNGETEVLNLKTAMSAAGLNRADKRIIKNRINEISGALKESRARMSYFETVRDRLESLIETTDIRTTRFEEYKKPFVESLKRFKPDTKTKTTPPPLPPSDPAAAGKSGGKTPPPIPPAGKPTPPPLPGASAEENKSDVKSTPNNSGSTPDSTPSPTPDSTTKESKAGSGDTIAEIFGPLDKRLVKEFSDDFEKSLDVIKKFDKKNINNPKEVNAMFDVINNLRNRIIGFLSTVSRSGVDVKKNPLVVFERQLNTIMTNKGGDSKTMNEEVFKEIGIFYKKANKWFEGVKIK